MPTEPLSALSGLRFEADSLPATAVLPLSRIPIRTVLLKLIDEVEASRAASPGASTGAGDGAHRARFAQPMPRKGHARDLRNACAALLGWITLCDRQNVVPNKDSKIANGARARVDAYDADCPGYEFDAAPCPDAAPTDPEIAVERERDQLRDKVNEILCREGYVVAALALAGTWQREDDALRVRLASLEEENRAMREALIGAALLSRAKDGLPCWCMALEHDQTCLRARAALRGKEDGSHG